MVYCYVLLLRSIISLMLCILRSTCSNRKIVSKIGFNKARLPLQELKSRKEDKSFVLPNLHNKAGALMLYYSNNAELFRSVNLRSLINEFSYICVRWEC